MGGDSWSNSGARVRGILVLVAAAVALPVVVSGLRPRDAAQPWALLLTAAMAVGVLCAAALAVAGVQQAAGGVRVDPRGQPAATGTR